MSKNKSTDFIKDEVGSKLLKGAIGLAGARLLKQILYAVQAIGWVISADAIDLVEKSAGLIVSWNASDFQVDVSKETVYADGEVWYGRVKYNNWTERYEAIDYYGSNKIQIALQIKRIERIIYVKTGMVIATKSSVSPLNAGDGLPALPHQDSGNF